MKKILFITSLSLFGLNLFAQTITTLDKSKLSIEDIKLLSQFWNELKKDLNNKNKIELSTLINFPFTCDFCIDYIKPKENQIDIPITKKIYDQGLSKIFFDSRLLKTINKIDNIIDILAVSYENEKTNYYFSYTSVEPSKEWEGQQHFFTLQKIGGKYLIVSVWTVP